MVVVGRSNTITSTGTGTNSSRTATTIPTTCSGRKFCMWVVIVDSQQFRSSLDISSITLTRNGMGCKFLKKVLIVAQPSLGLGLKLSNGCGDDNNDTHIRRIHTK